MADIPTQVRELCLAFPDVEEFESHGSPHFRARKGKVFAVFAPESPALEQSRVSASAASHIYIPQYVGPSGWIGVELNRGLSWTRVIELVHMAYVNSSPAKLVAQVTMPPAIKAPNTKMKPE